MKTVSLELSEVLITLLLNLIVLGLLSRILGQVAKSIKQLKKRKKIQRIFKPLWMLRLLLFHRNLTTY